MAKLVERLRRRRRKRETVGAVEYVITMSKWELVGKGKKAGASILKLEVHQMNLDGRFGNALPYKLIPQLEPKIVELAKEVEGE
jgi:hypothetical protein